uniref:Putative ORF3 n=1 Tax=Torque teno carollia perspicillata virus TaxID=2054617 RepID=A0A2H4QBG9_9VIRU|nr:putative ORF3 [Torque teno carollia perspicillata virus]
MLQTPSLIQSQTNQGQLPEPIQDFNKYRYRTRLQWGSQSSIPGILEGALSQKKPSKGLLKALKFLLSQRSTHRVEKEKKPSLSEEEASSEEAESSSTEDEEDEEGPLQTSPDTKKLLRLVKHLRGL